MNQLKKLLGLSLISSLGVCFVFFIVFANKPLNAQTPSNTNSLSSNSNSASEKSWLEISAPVAGGITSTVASIFSILGASKIKEERIKQLKEDCERKEKELKDKEEQRIKEVQEIEEKLRDKFDSSEEQKKINTDFYALVSDEHGNENMAVTGQSKLHMGDESQKEFGSRMSKRLKEFECSRKAINALLFSHIDKEGKEKKLLKSIVFEVIDNNFPNISDAEFDEKCIHLYSYLRGWLVCSIRYKNTQLPVEWIKNNALTNQDKIKILDGTRIFILNNEKVSQYIEEESRKLISEYINILIEKI